ncbi:pseudouridine synthase, RluA family [Clostridiales bacterium KA00134]|nr:pseudouridine synthase, RluA family [Clostridiales bacterium KA00134]
MNLNFEDKNKFYTLQVKKSYKKLRDFLKAQEISSRYIKRAIKNQEIFLNFQKVTKNHELKAKDTISLYIPDEEYNVICQEKKLDIIYEDEDLLAVNKPGGIIVHAVGIEQEGTLSNFVGGYFQKNGIKRKVRVINRLDRDTSGLVLFAKNSMAHSVLAAQFIDRSIEKIYIAAIKGYLEGRGRIEAPIGLGEDGIKREVRSDGKMAITEYEEIGKTQEGSILRLKLLTGRTHQIRVHLKSLGHPILGDSLYEGQSDLIKRQALHSKELTFKHPRNGKIIKLDAALPEDMEKLISSK